MGFIFGLIKRIVKAALCFAVFFAIIVFIPNLPPYTEFPVIALDPIQPRVGPLAPNDVLNNAQKLYDDKISSPEAFNILGDEVYTSLSSGEIVKISSGQHITFVTKIGQPCTGHAQEHICGRPLGFKIDPKQNIMYVADAYYGIWKVDIKTDKKQLLVSPRVEIEGRKPLIFNAVALDTDGQLYWTDSSTNFPLYNGAIDILTNPSGRLLHYNAAKNESKVLINNMYFPNGLLVSPDNKIVVVAETGSFGLRKYYLDGPKKGKSEAFVSGLPGMPDNIQALPDGSGMIVALYAIHDDDHPILIRSLCGTPIVRKFLARLQKLVEIPFEYLHSVYPHVILEEIVHFIGHFKSVSSSVRTGLAVVDWNGKIIESYYNTDGTMGPISDAIVYNDKLYVGSPNNQNFIAAVPAPALLRKAFDKKNAASQQTKEIPKPKVETKPEKKKIEEPTTTTETPKPKVETKPEIKKVVEPKTTTETPKPKVETKPEIKKVVETKTTTPSPKTEEKKSAVKESPKVVNSGQPAKTATPATPKTTTSKPVTKTTPKQAETKTTPEPVKTSTTTNVPKPEAKEQPSKLVENKPPANGKEQSPTTPKPKQTQQPKEEKPKSNAIPKTSNDAPVPNQIPIKEEIPSDTAKPNKDKLKVIKKAGPTEIPNPSP